MSNINIKSLIEKVVDNKGNKIEQMELFEIQNKLRAVAMSDLGTVNDILKVTLYMINEFNSIDSIDTVKEIKTRDSLIEELKTKNKALKEENESLRVDIEMASIIEAEPSVKTEPTDGENEKESSLVNELKAEIDKQSFRVSNLMAENRELQDKLEKAEAENKRLKNTNLEKQIEEVKQNERRIADNRVGNMKKSLDIANGYKTKYEKKAEQLENENKKLNKRVQELENTITEFNRIKEEEITNVDNKADEQVKSLQVEESGFATSQAKEATEQPVSSNLTELEINSLIVQLHKDGKSCRVIADCLKEKGIIMGKSTVQRRLSKLF